MDYITVKYDWLANQVEICENHIIQCLDRVDDIFFERIKLLIERKRGANFFQKLLFYSDIPNKYPESKELFEDVCRERFVFNWSFRNMKLNDMYDHIKNIKELLNVAKKNNIYEIVLSSFSANLLKNVMDYDFDDL